MPPFRFSFATKNNKGTFQAPSISISSCCWLKAILQGFQYKRQGDGCNMLPRGPISHSDPLLPPIFHTVRRITGESQPSFAIKYINAIITTRHPPSPKTPRLSKLFLVKQASLSSPRFVFVVVVVKINLVRPPATVFIFRTRSNL